MARRTCCILLSALAVGRALVCLPCGPGTDRECPAATLKEGDECGGLCGDKGWCEGSLSCIRPVDESGAASILKHALGVPRVGQCAKVDPTLKEGEDYEVIHPFGGLQHQPMGKIGGFEAPRKLLSEEGPIMGGQRGIDAADPEVSKVAEAAVELMKKPPSDLKNKNFKALASEAELVSVVKGTTQVVSGVRYRLLIKVATGKEAAYYHIDVVSQPWLKPPLTLLDASEAEAPSDP